MSFSEALAGAAKAVQASANVSGGVVDGKDGGGRTEGGAEEVERNV